MTQHPICTYPKCNCQFDMGPGNKCLRGYPQKHPDHEQHKAGALKKLVAENEKFATENEALREENERLKGIKPELPPFPPGGEGLPRYGLRWNGPTEPLATPFDNGYWTPWHLAEALRVERDQLAARVERLESVLTPKAVDFIRCGIGGNYGGSFYDDEMDRTYWPVKQAIDETLTQSVAHIKAAGATELLERAMKAPSFSPTVVRVDVMQKIISRMEGK